MSDYLRTKNIDRTRLIKMMMIGTGFVSSTPCFLGRVNEKMASVHPPVRAVHCLKWPALGPRINKNSSGGIDGVDRESQADQLSELRRKEDLAPMRGGQARDKGRTECGYYKLHA